jgi:hypothetical protein
VNNNKRIKMSKDKILITQNNNNIIIETKSKEIQIQIDKNKDLNKIIQRKKIKFENITMEIKLKGINDEKNK